jgi:hypothetical protein
MYKFSPITLYFSKFIHISSFRRVLCCQKFHPFSAEFQLESTNERRCSYLTCFVTVQIQCYRINMVTSWETTIQCYRINIVTSWKTTEAIMGTKLAQDKTILHTCTYAPDFKMHFQYILKIPTNNVAHSSRCSIAKAFHEKTIFSISYVKKKRLVLNKDSSVHIFFRQNLVLKGIFIRHFFAHDTRKADCQRNLMCTHRMSKCMGTIFIQNFFNILNCCLRWQEHMHMSASPVSTPLLKWNIHSSSDTIRLFI